MTDIAPLVSRSASLEAVTPTGLVNLGHSLLPLSTELASVFSEDSSPHGGEIDGAFCGDLVGMDDLVSVICRWRRRRAHRMDQYWQHHDLKAKDLLFSGLTPKDLEISTNVVRNIPRMAETDSNEPFFGLDSGAVLP
jgi:hypothetical protein